MLHSLLSNKMTKRSWSQNDMRQKREKRMNNQELILNSARLDVGSQGMEDSKSLKLSEKNQKNQPYLQTKRSTQPPTREEPEDEGGMYQQDSTGSQILEMG